MALVGAIGGLIATGVNTVNQINQADAAGKQMKQTQAEETQLLAEANQAKANEEAAPGLIAQRNAQESSISQPNAPYTASGTILSPSMLEVSLPADAAQPKELLGT